MLKIDNKRAYVQAYLEQCTYKLKKKKTVSFIDSEIIDEDITETEYKKELNNEKIIITIIKEYNIVEFIT